MKTKAPRTGPKKLANPPRSVMNTMLPDRVLDGGDHESVPAVARNADAERRGLRRVVADGLEAETEGRADDAPHDERGQDEHGKRVIVVRADEVVDLRQALEAPPEERGAQKGHALVAA